MKVEHYVCDYCKEDIPPNHGLELHEIRISKLHGITKEFGGQVQFCGEECLLKQIHSIIASVNENGKEVPNVEIDMTASKMYENSLT